jgi:4-hydroxybenzoate polyprenyltransferase
VRRRPIASIAVLARELDGLVRLHFLFFTCLWPLLGAASVRRDGSWGDVLAMLAPVACFHVYAFVLNDVIDLPIDRTNPSRRRDPLVRGAISPRLALALALVQPVVAIALTMAIGGDIRTHAALLVAFVAMGVYNLWGKRCPVPPLTDVIQGVGWGVLAIYAAYAMRVEPNALTWMVFAYGVAFTLFMNGIHGGLRDLANDVACAALTTAIVLGARPGPPGGDPIVPRAVVIFAWATLLLLVALNVALMVRNDFGYSAGEWVVTSSAVAALNLGALALEPLVVRPRAHTWNLAFRLQMFLVIMSLPVGFAGFANVPTLLLLGSLMLLSLALLEWTPAVAQWAFTAKARRRLLSPKTP